MNAVLSRDGVPQRLILVGALHLSLGIVLWVFSGGWSEMFGYYFKYLGSAFLVSFAFLELAFSRRVRSGFQKGEELHRAWTLMTVGAGLRLIGVFLAHGLNADERTRNIGFFISGPLPFATLVWGLAIVIRLYRRLGYTVRLHVIDWILLAGCVAMAISGVYQNMITPSSGFFTDTVLCVLLFQAMLLKRSVSQMGGGLVAACWTSYVVAIYLTALGDVGITLVAYNLVPGPLLPITWLIWYPAAVSFALAPAFLSQAVDLATRSERSGKVSTQGAKTSV